MTNETNTTVETMVSLGNLTRYDEKLKAKVAVNDAATLQSAKDYADGLKTVIDANVNANAEAITALETGKADKATTLSGYGIADAYTKNEADSAIATAVANADHLKREIVDVLPEVSVADEHTIYMIPKTTKTGNQQYDEYMLINGEFELIGDSAVDLTNYSTKTEVYTAKQEAIDTASADATGKANTALSDAKSYADGLSTNYATSAQGAKADTAIQSVVSGTANGSVSVDGVDVAVKGLDSAAFAKTTDFDASGTAETKVNELANGAVATNTGNILALQTKVDELASVTYRELTNEEIDALFA